MLLNGNVCCNPFLVKIFFLTVMVKKYPERQRRMVSLYLFCNTHSRNFNDFAVFLVKNQPRDDICVCQCSEHACDIRAARQFISKISERLVKFIDWVKLKKPFNH